MNNCLVTKLKSSVNNEDLSKLNVLTIKTKTIDSPTNITQWFIIGASEKGSVSVNSPSVGLYKSGISGELYPYPYNVLPNTMVNSHFENKDGIIEVTGKYNISKIAIGIGGTVRMREIYGIPGTITELNLRNIEEGEIDVNKLNNTINRSKLIGLGLPRVKIINKLSKNVLEEFKAIESINDSFCYLFDNIGLDDLANNVAIKTLQFIGGLNGGNLSSLAKLTQLILVNFSDMVQNIGDIMDFINPWIQAGRTSGKINVRWLLGQKNITLNGQPVTYPSEVPNSNAYLNWTSDGTVTFTAS